MHCAHLTAALAPDLCSSPMQQMQLVTHATNAARRPCNQCRCTRQYARWACRACWSTAKRASTRLMWPSPPTRLRVGRLMCSGCSRVAQHPSTARVGCSSSMWPSPPTRLRVSDPRVVNQRVVQPRSAPPQHSIHPPGDYSIHASSPSHKSGWVACCVWGALFLQRAAAVSGRGWRPARQGALSHLLPPPRPTALPSPHPTALPPPRSTAAVEVDGPVHFATNSRHLMGGTALKRRLLQVSWSLGGGNGCSWGGGGRGRPSQLPVRLHSCLCGQPPHPPPPKATHLALPCANRSIWAGRQWRCPSTNGGACHPHSAAPTCAASCSKQACHWKAAGIVQQQGQLRYQMGSSGRQRMAPLNSRPLSLRRRPRSISSSSQQQLGSRALNKRVQQAPQIWGPPQGCRSVRSV